MCVPRPHGSSDQSRRGRSGYKRTIYFKARNGTYKRIQFNDGDNAGITLYYTSPGPNVTIAFKPGFRMLTGDSHNSLLSTAHARPVIQ